MSSGYIRYVHEMLPLYQISSAYIVRLCLKCKHNVEKVLMFPLGKQIPYKCTTRVIMSELLHYSEKMGQHKENIFKITQQTMV